MQFSTVLGLTAAASVASAQFANHTSTVRELVANSTTVITVTSCEQDKCHTVPVTTGVAIVTETINNVVTVYTTYCPLTTAPASPAKPTTEVPVTTKPVTKASSSASTTVAHPSSASTSAKVSTYEGVAAKAVPAFAAVAAGVALLI